jgi:hypothetical protein
MSCADFEKIVHELARDDGREVLGEAATVMARFHAETCEACAARLAEARVLALALGDVAQSASREEAPERVEALLMGRFREQYRGMERVRYRERQRRLRWAEWISLAAAAAALLAVGAWNFSRGRVNVPKGNPSAHVASTPGSNGSNASGTGSVATAGTTAMADDASSDFVPVPYAEGLSQDDGGLVVRVSMTRSALGSLGYPVDEINGGDVIQADVLVGEDGWPRAVRLVQ